MCKLQNWGVWLKQGHTAPPPPPHLPNPPAAKFASQGDAHKRTHTQIKFLYYPLLVIYLSPTLLNTETISIFLCLKQIINFTSKLESIQHLKTKYMLTLSISCNKLGKTV